MNLALYLNFILLLFVWRAAVLLYRNEPITVLGVNLTNASFDALDESAPYILTLADNAGSPDPSQVDYNNGSNQWYEITTPTLNIDIGGSNITIANEYVRAVKEGKKYTIIARFTFTRTAETGNILIEGLPAANTSASAAFVTFPVFSNKVNFGTNVGPIWGRLDPSGTSFGLYFLDGSGGESQITNSDLSSDSNVQMRFQFSYITD